MADVPPRLRDEIEALRRANTELLIEANRARYDAAATDRELRRLHAALAAARADITSLQTQLHTFETSRFWRLTRPMRLVIETVLGWRHAAPPAPSRDAAPPPPPPTYEAWIAEAEPACFAQLTTPGPPNALPLRVGLVLSGRREAAERESLLAECPPAWTVLAGERDDAVAAAVGQPGTDMLCFLDDGARLAPGALHVLAAALAHRPQLDLLFADEDWADAQGRRSAPFFKPAWDWELQLARGLAGPLACMRTALVRAAKPRAGPGWLHDLATQVAAASRPGRIHRIPAVLSHRTHRPAGASEALRQTAAVTLQCKGLAAQVLPPPAEGAACRIAYGLPSPAPPVSIIVPTRNRADLLRVCAEGVLHRTDYPSLELILVDNGSTEPEALALLQELSSDPRVRVLQQSGPFNWSALNNAAARDATGDVLVLLNNDIAVLQADWLAVLVSHAVQPGVGAVGAKLLYPDRRVQHAGLTTDETGIPRHVFRYAAADDPGLFGLLASAREVWGVTGACLAIARGVFFGAGGLNETYPVSYNDVELCLRLTAHGYRIIWTPWAVLEHREMATRPPDHTGARRSQVQEELTRLRRDWGDLVLHDPHLSPNLELVDEHPCFRRGPPLVQAI